MERSFGTSGAHRGTLSPLKSVSNVPSSEQQAYHTIFPPSDSC